MSSMKQNFQVPVVDMGKLRVGGREEADEAEWSRLTQCLDQAFTQASCARLVNHGITPDQMQKVFDGSAAFFHLPEEVKKQYTFSDFQGNGTGYIGLDSERYGDEPNLHEGYLLNSAQDLPENEVPGWRAASESLHKSLKGLAATISTGLSLALGKERGYLASLHQDLEKNGFTKLRFAHYPPVPEDTQPNSIRFSSHCDYNTFTLILQDDAGGLQVTDGEGNWFDVTPEPGSIILMAAQFLQFYSHDKYKALVHRVIIPEEDVKKRGSRYSIIYFTNADSHLPAWPTTAANLPQPPPTVREHMYSSLVEPQKRKNAAD